MLCYLSYGSAPQPSVFLSASRFGSCLTNKLIHAGVLCRSPSECPRGESVSGVAGVVSRVEGWRKIESQTDDPPAIQ